MQLILWKPYDLSNPSNRPWLTDCEIVCTDSTSSLEALSSLSINFVGRNNHAPKWSSDFPRFVVLTRTGRYVPIVTVNATDADIDKTSDARITYFIDSIDGVVDPPEGKRVAIFDSENSSQLVFYDWPPNPLWRVGSNHTITIRASDNVSLLRLTYLNI